MCIYLGTSEVSEGEMLFLLNAELRAVLSSYQSSQTFSKLSEDHLKSCPGTNAIFTLLFKLGLVSFKKKKKRTSGILFTANT